MNVLTSTMLRDASISFPMLGDWSVDPPYSFELFGLDIYFYGVIIAMGFILASVYCAHRAPEFGLTSDNLYELVIWLIPICIIGARLYYVLFKLDYFVANPGKIFALRDGGLAIYGGIIAGIITGIVWCRVRKIRVFAVGDLTAFGLLIGQAVGRWGNFVNQEAYGVPVTTPALQWFPLAVYIEREGGWFAATFFYESAWCFLICALILILERTRLFARPGRATLFYVFMYAAERTVVEGLRMDSLYLGSVRVSQALSALLLLAAALLLCLRLPRRRKWLLIPALAAIPLFFLSPLAYALLLLAVCLVCYVILPAGGEPPIRT